MKQCKHITGYTDYPFLELGDESGKRAPIRRVNIVRYDGNLYAIVSFPDNGWQLKVKSSYLYGNRARLGKGARQINRRKLERMLPAMR